MKRRIFISKWGMFLPFIASLKNNFIKSDEKKPGYVVKDKESRFHQKTILFGSNPVNIKVSSKDTEGVLSISEYVGYTKGGPPIHIHPNQDEIFIVLEGDHLFQLGDEQFHLTSGDTLFIPRGVPHAPAQLSDKGRYYFFFTPSGKMEDFFRALGNLKVQGQASPEQMSTLFAEHDMKIVGPPIKI